jgi:1-deoxy-D-xylulose-5-phosphate synthase
MALHDRGRSRCAIRAARPGLRAPAPQVLEIGKGRCRDGKKVAILSLGTGLAEAEKAADQLDAMGCRHACRPRFAKPLDRASSAAARDARSAVTVEEAAIGGLGAHVLTLASDEG